MLILESEALLSEKIQWQNVIPSGNRTQASHSLWFQVQHSPFYTNLAFAWTTETLGSLYSHALLTPTKSSKSKNQVVHQQKFKDLLSSTCQVSIERRVLDLESEVMRGLGSIPTGGNIFHQIFFHIVKPPMPILALLPMLFVCENPEWSGRNLLGATFLCRMDGVTCPGKNCRKTRRPTRLCTGTTETASHSFH